MGLKILQSLPTLITARRFYGALPTRLFRLGSRYETSLAHRTILMKQGAATPRPLSWETPRLKISLELLWAMSNRNNLPKHSN